MYVEIYVHPATGDDISGLGTKSKPYKTIDGALEFAKTIKSDEEILLNIMMGDGVNVPGKTISFDDFSDNFRFIIKPFDDMYSTISGNKAIDAGSFERWGDNTFGKTGYNKEDFPFCINGREILPAFSPMYACNPTVSFREGGAYLPESVLWGFMDDTAYLTFNLNTGEEIIKSRVTGIDKNRGYSFEGEWYCFAQLGENSAEFEKYDNLSYKGYYFENHKSLLKENTCVYYGDTESLEFIPDSSVKMPYCVTGCGELATFAKADGKNISFRYMDFTGGKISEDAIMKFSGCSEISFNKCRFTDIPKSVFCLRDFSGSIRIENCEFINVSGSIINSRGSGNIILRNCYIENSGCKTKAKPLFEISGAKLFEISKTTVSSCESNVAELSDVKSAKIVSSRILKSHVRFGKSILSADSSEKTDLRIWDSFVECEDIKESFYFGKNVSVKIYSSVAETKEEMTFDKNVRESSVFTSTDDERAIRIKENSGFLKQIKNYGDIIS